MTTGHEAIYGRIEEVVKLTRSMVKRRIKCDMVHHVQEEDLVQWGVMWCLKYADQYDPAKSSLSTYVYRVAFSGIWHEYLRLSESKKRGADCVTLSYDNTFRTVEGSNVSLREIIDDPNDCIDMAINRLTVKTLMRDMPKICADNGITNTDIKLFLKYSLGNGVSIKETARTLGLVPSTGYWRYCRVREILRRWMQDERLS